jgi:hypothetical protein
VPRPWFGTGLVPEPLIGCEAKPSGRLAGFGRSLRLGLLFGTALLAAACAQTSPSQLGLTDLIARPAERSLLLGIKAYEDGQYRDAERLFDSALKAGLLIPKDRAAAHKHLAFIYCTTDRLQTCEEAFLAARRADAAFALSRSESGHPQWGPVYRRVLP